MKLTFSNALKKPTNLKHAVSTVQKRNFNSKTLKNIRNYLADNYKNTPVEENESGFLRLRLPENAMARLIKHDDGSDMSQQELVDFKKMRMNFWRQGDTGHGMGDDSIHCHPGKFKSYIIQGGYSHDLFDEKPCKNHKPCERFFLTAQQMGPYFKFKTDKTNGKVTFEGNIGLKNTGNKTSLAGQTAIIDDQMIHRVTEYNVTKESTLTLNLVGKGKGYYNVYLLGKKGEQVKLNRNVLTPEKAQAVVTEVIECIDNNIPKLKP